MVGQSRKSARNEQKQQHKKQESSQKSGQDSNEGQQKAVENDRNLKIEHSQQGRWTKQEHKRFVEALSLYGKNWKKVEEHVGTRSGAQIRSHAQKFFNRLEREFDQQFNGLKSSEIKQIFENQALHNLSFGEKQENQRRPRSDSINTNISLELISDEEKSSHPPIPIEKRTDDSQNLQLLPNQQTITLQNIIPPDILRSQPAQNNIFISHLLAENLKHHELDVQRQVNTTEIIQQLLEQMKAREQQLINDRIQQIVSAYFSHKEEQMNETLQEKQNPQENDQSIAKQPEGLQNQQILHKCLPVKEIQKDSEETDKLQTEQKENPLSLRKRYSINNMKQDESFFHFLMAKYGKQFSISAPSLSEWADMTEKKINEKLQVQEQQQQRSRRGSFVFCNEDEEENETRYQQLKKIKPVQLQQPQELVVQKKNNS